MATSASRFQSILCPVDFSAPSREALRYAVALAQRFDSRITAVSVSDPLLAAAARRIYGSQRRVLDASKAELSRFVADAIGRRSAARVVVCKGTPASEILRVARRVRSDLILMGSHGAGGLVRFFFGSTTEQVLLRSSVPVFAFSSGRHARRISAHRRAVDRVVCPVDAAGGLRADATRAADVAEAFGVELLLVHVIRPLDVPPWLRTSARADASDRIESARTALDRARAGLRVPSSVAVALGDPAHVIARFSRRGSPLVVMSLKGGARLWGRRSALAYHVLTHSAAPVLALPGRVRRRRRR